MKAAISSPPTVVRSYRPVVIRPDPQRFLRPPRGWPVANAATRLFGATSRKASAPAARPVRCVRNGRASTRSGPTRPPRGARGGAAGSRRPRRTRSGRAGAGTPRAPHPREGLFEEHPGHQGALLVLEVGHADQGRRVFPSRGFIHPSTSRLVPSRQLANVGDARRLWRAAASARRSRLAKNASTRRAPIDAMGGFWRSTRRPGRSAGCPGVRRRSARMESSTCSRIFAGSPSSKVTRKRMVSMGSLRSGRGGRP
jgi:hypothetical protein